MKKILTALLVVTSFLQISCSSDTVNNSPTTNPVDVYVAGSKNGQACYWKNDQLILLNSGTLTGQLSAEKIIVSDNDVHVYGTVYYPNEDIIKYLYWKNNVLTDLSETFSSTNSTVLSITDMEINNNDVYFVGYTQEATVSIAYWKNGLKTTLESVQNLIDNVKIKVLNNTVYINGKVNNVEGYYVDSIFYPKLNSNLKGFAINNNEVYTMGSIENTQVNGFYKNINTNSETTIPALNYISFLIFDNNNMYYSNNNEIYKNGALIYELPFTVGINFPIIKEFTVLNNNLYKIIGGVTNNETIDVNGTIIQTSTPEEYFNSLFIVQN